jgi:hypothetical protein
MASVSFCRPKSSIELRLLLPQADVNTKGKSAVPSWSVHRRPMGSAARSLSLLHCLDPFPILCDCSISLSLSRCFGPFLLGPCSRRMTLLFGQRLPHEPQNCTPKIHSLRLLLQMLTMRRVFSAEDQVLCFCSESFKSVTYTS